MNFFRIFLIAFILALPVPALAQTSAPCVLTSDSFPVGDSPLDIATGDFDSDGDLDVVTANNVLGTISVLLNTGDGRFTDRTDYPSGAGARFVVVGDVNNDNHLDLAIANQGEDTISVVINNGNGTFAPAVKYDAGTRVRSTAIGDLNGDGHPDIAASNSGDNLNNVSIFINNGDGTFAQQVTYDSPGNTSRIVAMGDLDGDNDLDLVVANAAGGVGNGGPGIAVLFNNGDGIFSNNGQYDVGAGPRSLVIEDLDGDNDLDVAVASVGGSLISVLLNDGDGTFAIASNVNVPNAFYVTAADLNGDQSLDLAVTNTTNGLTTLINNGDGTFVTGAVFQTGLLLQVVAVADVNNSPDVDLIVVDAFPTGSVTVLSPCRLGDVNRDGRVNLLDIGPFIAVLSSGGFQEEADTDPNGIINLADINPFIAILNGQ